MTLDNERPLSAKAWKAWYQMIQDGLDAGCAPLIIVVGEEGTKNIPDDILIRSNIVDNRENRS